MTPGRRSENKTIAHADRSHPPGVGSRFLLHRGYYRVDGGSIASIGQIVPQGRGALEILRVDSPEDPRWKDGMFASLHRGTPSPVPGGLGIVADFAD